MTVSNSGLLTRGANTVAFSNGTIGNSSGDLYFHIYAPTTVSTSFGTSGSPAGFNFIKDGTSTLTFNPSTASYLGGRLQVHTGTMVINNASLTVAAADTWVGSQGNANAILTLSGSTAYSTMNTAGTAGMSVTVGDGAGSTGVLNIQDTAALTTLNLYVGGANGQNYSGNGTVNQFNEWNGHGGSDDRE